MTDWIYMYVKITSNNIFISVTWQLVPVGQYFELCDRTISPRRSYIVWVISIATTVRGTSYKENKLFLELHKIGGRECRQGVKGPLSKVPINGLKDDWIHTCKILLDLSGFNFNLINNTQNQYVINKYCFHLFYRYIIINSGILQILRVNKEDEGHYSCHATSGGLHHLPDIVDNIRWKRSSEAYLTVKSGTYVYCILKIMFSNLNHSTNQIWVQSLLSTCTCISSYTKIISHSIHTNTDEFWTQN